MVKLALRIAPHITGHVHIQTNPYYSFSTEKTIVNALRTPFSFPTPSRCAVLKSNRNRPALPDPPSRI